MTYSVELDNEWWKIWKNRRYILCLMFCLGLLCMYCTRINLSIAIVAMTSSDDSSEETSDDPEFDWSPQMKGYLLSSFFYGYAAMQVPSGVIVKYIPPHVLYFLAVFVSAVLTALIPIAANQFWLLIVFRVIMGAFQAAAIPTAAHFMTNWAPPLERSRMQGINISGAFIGSVLVYPISGFVGEMYGWQWIFYVFAVISFVWCVVWAICIRAKPEDDKYISKREIDYIQRSIGKREEKQEDDIPLTIPWVALLTSIPVWSISLGNFAWGWGFQTMLAQLPPFLNDVAGFDLGKNGLLSSLPYITMTIMSWTAGYVADLLLVKGLSVTQVRKTFMSSALFFQGVFIVIAAFIYNAGGNIACISMSIGLGAFTYAVIGVNPLDLGPPYAPIVAGMSNTMGTITGIISPILTGYIVTADSKDIDTLKWQWKIIFFISAGIYFAGSLIYYLGGSGELQPWAKLQQNEKKSYGMKKGVENRDYEED